MKSIAIIPARFDSSRLPGKPLLKIRGREIIVHVADQVSKTSGISDVLVATDDDRIAEVVRREGYGVVMTSSGHRTGTDRIAEAARYLDADIVVNVQGDEPMIRPEMIRQALLPFESDQSLVMGTLKSPMQKVEELFDPNCAKVVVDANDFALYFSRSPLPYLQGQMDWKTLACHEAAARETPFFIQVGLYVFTKDFLLCFSSMKRGVLEKAEKLEQLRALEAGYKIKVPTTEYDTVSVDTPADYEKAKTLMESE